MRESKIEAHLRREVTKAGGKVYKFTSPGRRNVPDRLVIWPGKRIIERVPLVSGRYVIHLKTERGPADTHFIELKAPGKKARAGQAREHARLMALQAVVLVLDTLEKVDQYVEQQRKERHL